MDVNAYMQQVEEGFDRPDRLRALREQAQQDQQLDELERADVLARIGTYEADAGRAHYDEDLGEPTGEEGPED